MAKDKFSANDEDVSHKETSGKRLAFEVEIPESNELVICKVCGHKNPKDTGMCLMCSNYLFD